MLNLRQKIDFLKVNETRNGSFLISFLFLFDFFFWVKMPLVENKSSFFLDNSSIFQKNMD